MLLVNGTHTWPDQFHASVLITTIPTLPPIPHSLNSLIRLKRFQILQINLPQSLLIRRTQKHFRHNLIPRGFPLLCLKGFEPTRCAETPFAAAFHAGDGAEVVALARGEVEEFVGDDGGDGVVAEVAAGDFAVPVAEVAGHGRGGVEG